MSLSPLRQPGFRLLWLVWLSANLTMWMSDVAASWLMTALSDNVLLVAMMQSAASMPLFLLGLPCGTLADMVDRRRYLLLTQCWVVLMAGLLAILSFSALLSAPLLLAFSCLNGIGMAMRWPLFAAILPDVVLRAQLPTALALNGVAANLARIIGPLLAGAMLAAVGSSWVFLLNAILSLMVVPAIWRLPPPAAAAPQRSSLWAAMRAGVCHVRQSALLRLLLARIALFFLQTSALTALLPLLALRMDRAGPLAYTAALVAMAVGGILMALNLPRLRRAVRRDTALACGIYLHAAASVLAASTSTWWLALPALTLAGMAWICAANTLTVAMQMALPDQVRARGMAIYLMAVMGGTSAGAALWGLLARLGTLQLSVISAAVLSALIFRLSAHHSIGQD